MGTLVSKLLILILSRAQDKWTWHGPYKNCCFWPGRLFSMWFGKARFKRISLKWSNRHREAEAWIWHSPGSTKSRPLTRWECFLGRLTDPRTLLSLSLFRLLLFQESSCRGLPNQPHNVKTPIFNWVFQIFFSSILILYPVDAFLELCCRLYI